VDPNQCPFDLSCDENKVVKLLSSLDITKASTGEPDNISAHTLKVAGCSIASSIGDENCLTFVSEMKHCLACGNALMWYLYQKEKTWI